MNIALDFTITFERIGRNSAVHPFTYRLDPTSSRSFDGLVDAIYRHVGRYLASREYQVDVILDPDTNQGVVTIDGGRFGKGTITPAQPDALDSWAEAATRELVSAEDWTDIEHDTGGSGCCGGHHR